MNAITLRLTRNTNIVLVAKSEQDRKWMLDTFGDEAVSRFNIGSNLELKYRVKINQGTVYVPIGYEIEQVAQLQSYVEPLFKFEIETLPLWVEVMGSFYPIVVYPKVKKALHLRGLKETRYLYRPERMGDTNMIVFGDEICYVKDSVTAWRLYKAGGEVLSPKITRQGKDIHAHDLYLVSLGVEENSRLWKDYYLSQMWDMHKQYTAKQWLEMYDDANNENVNWWVS